ncbi:hypothetical protein BDZ97DRAFT_1844326 [Flammula alnicola]|nr:hypothetical protein BDZ97DRAFT_1844326 [Flammula alnicola]
MAYFSLSDDRLIFVQDSVVKIWDYKAEAWASWTIEGEFHQIIVAQTFVILLHTSGVSIWRIPALSTQTPLFGYVDPSPLPPLFECPYPDLKPSELDDGTARLHRYEVVVDEDLSKADIIVRDTFNVNVPFDATLEPLRFCNNSLVAWWYDTDTESIKIHTGSLAAPSTLITSSTDVVDNVRQAVFSTNASFCPVSGRFAFIKEGEAGVVILDFLPNPVSESKASKSRSHHHPWKPLESLAIRTDDLPNGYSVSRPTQF